MRSALLVAREVLLSYASLGLPEADHLLSILAAVAGARLVMSLPFEQDKLDKEKLEQDRRVQLETEG